MKFRRTPKQEADSTALINQASDLRDQLLVSVTKLEEYASVLSIEVARIRELAEHEKKPGR